MLGNPVVGSGKKALEELGSLKFFKTIGDDMSLAKCKNCPNKLADKARYCPECGYPVDEKFNVTPEDFLRDTVNKGKSDKISPDSGQPMLLLEHQGHEYLWDDENFGVWIDKSILEGIDREAAQVVLENLAEEDQRYFNHAKE